MIYRAYRQLSSGEGKTIQGTGLGLHICQTNTEMHGGTLGIASTAAVGSVFSCVVPLLLAEIDASCVQDSSALASQHPSTRLGTLTYDTASSELEGALILLVDDSALNVRLLERKLLLALGESICCISASDGKQAVGMYKDLLERREKKLHAVVMDYHMPIMSGKDAIIAMRALEVEHGLPKVPIAAYTAGGYYAHDNTVACTMFSAAHTQLPVVLWSKLGHVASMGLLLCS
jgi:CheY-like chemotaxis protein